MSHLNGFYLTTFTVQGARALAEAGRVQGGLVVGSRCRAPHRLRADDAAAVVQVIPAKRFDVGLHQDTTWDGGTLEHPGLF